MNGDKQVFAGPAAASELLGRLGRVVSMCLIVGCSSSALAQSYNTAFGTGAAAHDGTLCGDSAFGAWSLNRASCSAAQPTYSVAVGYDALYWNTGAFETAVGASTLVYNTTGRGNTAVGYEGLFTNKIAQFNTAVGTAALQNNDSDGQGKANLNTAVGANALEDNVDGSHSTAVGYGALENNHVAGDNTAVGFQALQFNDQVGADLAIGNTAVGALALEFNIDGSHGTAVGFQALSYNTNASDNTAIGYQALEHNDSDGHNTALNNTAVGYQALSGNIDGSNNTAVGYEALLANGGSYNTAFGVYALYSNSIGYGNVAQGFNALYTNSKGIRNTAVGNQALYGNSTGSYNTALGFYAGYYQTTGTDDIYIANAGVAGESHTLRLGTQGSVGVEGSGIVSAYIAGVHGVTIAAGTPVYISSSGQLGTVQASSQRFKTDIKTMGAATGKLTELRPVTFKYKTDATGTRQYGLIAEEVAKVYPELVIRGADGRIDGVRYEELTPMLLNEVQQQRIQLQAMQAKVARLEQLNESMQAAIVRLLPKDERLAAR